MVLIFPDRWIDFVLRTARQAVGLSPIKKEKKE